MPDLQPDEITTRPRPRGLREVGGPWGYGGAAYRRLTHWLSCWVFGLPAWALLRLLWRVEVVGKERLSELRPPFLMVSNHQSLIDSHVACLAFGLWPRGLLDPHIAPFHTPEARNFMHSALGGALHTALRCVPFSRGQGLHQPAMNTVIELLRGAAVVYMFPEGTRTRDGIIGRGQPGVGRVVLESGCSVLPVHLDGLSDVLPVGAKRPRVGGRIRVAVGPTIPPDRWADVAQDRAGYLEVSEALLDEVRALAPTG